MQSYLFAIYCETVACDPNSAMQCSSTHSAHLRIFRSLSSACILAFPMGFICTHNALYFFVSLRSYYSYWK